MAISSGSIAFEHSSNRADRAAQAIVNSLADRQG